MAKTGAIIHKQNHD